MRGGYNLMGSACSGSQYPAALCDSLPGNNHHPNVTFRVALYVIEGDDMRGITRRELLRLGGNAAGLAALMALLGCSTRVDDGGGETVVGLAAEPTTEEAPESARDGESHEGDVVEEMLEVNGVRLATKQAGVGPDMVLVHGRTQSKETMDPFFERYRDRYHVVSYDVRGHGKTESSGEFTLDDLSDDLEGLVSALHLSKPVVIGHSMGSYIALRAAERYPNLFSGLVLMGTRGGRASSPWPVTDEVGRALESFDNLTDASRVVVPALVMTGEYDSLNPPEEGKLVADALPDAIFEVVPGAGHGIYDGNPDFVFGQIDGFLGRLGL